jgi:hypothetical protein
MAQGDARREQAFELWGICRVWHWQFDPGELEALG